jgi:hypothetical protein
LSLLFFLAQQVEDPLEILLLLLLAVAALAMIVVVFMVVVIGIPTLATANGRYDRDMKIGP